MAAIIGSIRTESGERYPIFWDGTTLCDMEGQEIPDGEAFSQEEAQDLAAWLWSAQEWDYRAEESA